MEYYETDDWNEEEEDIPSTPLCCQETYLNAMKEFNKREEKIKDKSDEAIATIHEMYEGVDQEIAVLKQQLDTARIALSKTLRELEACL